MRSLHSVIDPDECVGRVRVKARVKPERFVMRMRKRVGSR